MKQTKKLLAVLLMISAAACVGCSGEKAVAPTEVSKEANGEVAAETEAAPAPEEVSTVKLNEAPVEADNFTVKVPEGWENTMESGVVKMDKGEDQSIVAMFIPGTDFGGIDIEEYAAGVTEQMKNNGKIALDVVNTETKTLPAGDAMILTLEMPFTEEFVQGWLNNGTLTQEKIDAAGGVEKFIETTKITQIQTHIPTNKGLVTLCGQTIGDEEVVKEVKDAAAAVAESFVIK